MTAAAVGYFPRVIDKGVLGYGEGWLFSPELDLVSPFGANKGDNCGTSVWGCSIPDSIDDVVDGGTGSSGGEG